MAAWPVAERAETSMPSGGSPMCRDNSQLQAQSELPRVQFQAPVADRYKASLYVLGSPSAQNGHGCRSDAPQNRHNADAPANISLAARVRHPVTDPSRFFGALDGVRDPR